ncbi:hypothetical protein TH61_15185 [Rufibacter sp. DG15C]|uniref:hypothetical protein n=1 Tax=Rufibacter sp. DG15C TaxID=1379909 RepID=UPI00078B4858|nr:hypothetical protein [Rufibacter sp. DG15C]AMM52269.1 hypothetical protein TH61_15185 [Rufibacter sp. DG15C]
MNETLVPLAQYLTYAQAVDLYNDLMGIEVVALVKSCGPPTLPYGAGTYYQLLVKQQDLLPSQIVLAEFSQKQAKNESLALACPRCSSTQVGLKANLSWWRKIIYAGTTVWKCQTCHRTYFK